MEHHKISKLLNNSTVSNFMTKKWIKVNDLFNREYCVNKSKRFKTPMLRSHFCDSSDVYIVEKGAINIKTGVNDDMPIYVMHSKN